MPIDINRKREARLSYERLREVLHYDSASGKLCFLKNMGTKAAGSEAGHAKQDSRDRNCWYVRVGIDRKQFYAHRLIWFYVTKVWPSNEIDHKDGDGLNNRWSNLREATRNGNCQNARMRTNKSGIKGVTFVKADASHYQKEHYRVIVDHKQIGNYRSLQEAKAAREAAARAAHGEFYREQ